MKRVGWGALVLVLILTHVQSLESVREAAGRFCLARGWPRFAYDCFAGALRARLQRSFEEDVSDLHRAMLDATLDVMNGADEASRGDPASLDPDAVAALQEAVDQILRYTKDVSLPVFEEGERERFDGLSVQLLGRLIWARMAEEDLAAVAALQGRQLAFRVTAGRPKPTGPPPPLPIARRLVDPMRLLPWLDQLGIGEAARADVEPELRAYVAALARVKINQRTFPSLAALYAAAATAREARGETGPATDRLHRLEAKARALAAEGGWAVFEEEEGEASVGEGLEPARGGPASGDPARGGPAPSGPAPGGPPRGRLEGG